MLPVGTGTPTVFQDEAGYARSWESVSLARQRTPLARMLLERAKIGTLYYRWAGHDTYELAWTSGRVAPGGLETRYIKVPRSFDLDRALVQVSRHETVASVLCG